MTDWFKNNFTWLFDGLAIWIIGITGTIIGIFIKWFNKKYKIIKRKDYVDIDKLKKQLQEYIKMNNLFKDFQFDEYDEIYFKVNSNGRKEFFCPRCKDTDLKSIHLEKCEKTIGNVYVCKQCNKSFGKGYYAPIENPYKDIIKW